MNQVFNEFLRAITSPSLFYSLGKASNFGKMTPEQQQSWMPFGTPYDYFSIMHFPFDAFSKNHKPTITPKNKEVSELMIVYNKGKNGSRKSSLFFTHSNKF